MKERSSLDRHQDAKNQFAEKASEISREFITAQINFAEAKTDLDKKITMMLAPKTKAAAEDAITAAQQKGAETERLIFTHAVATNKDISPPIKDAILKSVAHIKDLDRSSGDTIGDPIDDLTIGIQQALSEETSTTLPEQVAELDTRLQINERIVERTHDKLRSTNLSDEQKKAVEAYVQARIKNERMHTDRDWLTAANEGNISDKGFEDLWTKKKINFYERQEPKEDR